LTDRQRSQLEGDERDPFDSRRDAPVPPQEPSRRDLRGRPADRVGGTDEPEVAVDGERFDVVGSAA